MKAGTLTKALKSYDTIYEIPFTAKEKDVTFHLKNGIAAFVENRLPSDGTVETFFFNSVRAVNLAMDMLRKESSGGVYAAPGIDVLFEKMAEFAKIPNFVLNEIRKEKISSAALGGAILGAVSIADALKEGSLSSSAANVIRNKIPHFPHAAKEFGVRYDMAVDAFSFILGEKEERPTIGSPKRKEREMSR